MSKSNVTKITTQTAIKHFKMSKNVLEKLGITNYATEGKFKTLKDVLNSDTGMVNAQCVEDCSLRDIPMKRGESYAMSFSIYSQGAKNVDQNTKTKRPIFKPYRKKFCDMFNRYRGQDLTDKKLLVSRFGGIGDLIVIQSVLKAIKTKYPTCRITFATNKDFFELFNCFPEGIIDEVIPIPFNTKYLSQNDYHLLFINAIENCIETQKDNYYDIFKNVANLEYDSDQYISKLFARPEIDVYLNSLHLPKNMIGIHMESTTPLRRYPIELWKLVIDLLHNKGYTVGIIDSKSKTNDINNMILNIGVDSTKTINLASISETIAHGITIFNRCVGGIVIDSTFAHIAGALQVPSVAICGPYPAYNVVGRYKTVVGADKPNQQQVCEKEPCFLNSQVHECPFLMSNRYPACTSTISPERIVELLEQQISKFDKK